MFVIAEKYHVVSSLGEGGMGAVYEAVHAGTGRRVAVKMLRQEIAWSARERERFIREARIAGSLASNHVAEIFDAGTDEVSGLPFIVMELLEGPNLKELLRTRGRLSVGLTLIIAAHVANGLREAHDAGVVHRDIKPANIVVCTSRTEELVAKIVDFGVAKALQDEHGALTRTGDFVGSLRYMSPEQLSGEPASEASDLWSLGAVMYEALSGVGPAGNADSIGAIVRAVCSEEIKPLPSVAPWVPREVVDLVHRALMQNPRARFPSARAMQEAIVNLLPQGVRVPAAALTDDTPIVVFTAPSRALTDPGRRRKRVSLAVGIGLGLTTAATALFAHARLHRPESSSQRIAAAPGPRELEYPVEVPRPLALDTDESVSLPSATTATAHASVTIPTPAIPRGRSAGPRAAETARGPKPLLPTSSSAPAPTGDPRDHM
jgi:serine/threonine protein kinase